MKKYLIKFKDGVDEVKREAILAAGVVLNFLAAFGIYVVELAESIFFDLMKDTDILYVKEQS